MLDNAIQHHWKLVTERLYRIIPWLGGRMHFEGGKEDVHQCHTTIIIAVEQSVRRCTTRLCGWHPSSPWCVEAGSSCWRRLLLITKTMWLFQKCFLCCYSAGNYSSSRDICSKNSTTGRCGWHPSSPWCVDAGSSCWRRLLLITKTMWLFQKECLLVVNSNVITNYWITRGSF